MPLSPHFNLPSPCTFMTSRHGLPLPGVRELFPDLFRPRSMTTPRTPPSAAYEQQRPAYDDDMTSLPPVLTPRHPRPAPFHRSTAQNTATRTADHPYKRARFNSPAPSSSHTQPHGTQQWPNPDVVASTHTPHVSPTCTSPEVSPLYSQPPPQRVERWGAGQSDTIHDNELSSPMTSSPQTESNPAEFAPQPSSPDQKSVETHSGKKRHKCDICGSYWGRPSSLKIHMVSHTGVKEFMCSICKQDFGVKSNYTRHIRVHHKDSSEGIQTRVAGRRRRGSRRNQDGGPVRFVDEGSRFQGQ